MVQRERSLIGKWEGVDRTGKPGAFHFFEDGNVVLIIDGKPLGGPESGGLGMLRFTVDYQKDPIELDIIGVDPSGAEQGKILMIVQFITDSKIKIRTYFNDIRPDSFDEETIDDTIVLERAEKSGAEVKNHETTLKKKAIEVATIWTNSLLAGDVKKTLSVSDVPFIVDGEDETNDISELRRQYEEVLEDKGTRSIRITRAEVVDEKVDAPCCRDCSNIILVNCYVEKKMIQVCIKVGKSLKVVGFKE